MEFILVKVIVSCYWGRTNKICQTQALPYPNS